MSAGMARRSLFLERGLIVAGALLVVAASAGLGYRFLASRLALQEFDTRPAPAAAQVSPYPTGGLVVQGGESPELGLWSAKRIRAYKESLLLMKDPAIAVVSIPRLQIRVPVFEGTGELALNRGAGWIEGTARPGVRGDGNIGIASHRDGFFRALKDIAIGDMLELSAAEGLSTYVVDSLEIVSPEDVHVLRTRDVPSVTLVTCYPFYFAGDAPQRFIVHAAQKRQDGEHPAVSGSAASR